MTDQIKKEFEEALNAYANGVAERAALAEHDIGGGADVGMLHARVLALFEAQAKPEGWIAVSERLPDEGGTVLIVSNGWVMMGWRHGGTWTDWDGDECVVTHWMPLPAPPTQTDEK